MRDHRTRPPSSILIIKTSMSATAMAVIATMALVGPSARAQEALDPFWSGRAPNAWVHPTELGSPVPVRVGPDYARTSSALIGPGLVTFGLVGGGALAVALSLAQPAAVMTNRLAGSAPQPPSGPPVVVAGWGQATFRESGGVFLHPNGAEATPFVRLSPGSGTYTRAISVVFDTVSLGPVGSVSVALREGSAGGPIRQVIHSALGVLGPLPAGPSHIDWVITANGQTWTGSASYEIAVPLTVDVAAPGGGTVNTFLDSDGDGVPDAIELEYGGDPNAADLERDTDDDGWSDFDEFLRGSEPRCPGAPPCTPLDSDGDGWSDWDELRRGTAVDDATCRPVAAGLYEVELKANGVPHDLGLTGDRSVLEVGGFDVRGLDGSPRPLHGANGCELAFVPGPGRTGPPLPVAQLSLRLGAGTWAVSRSTGPATAPGSSGTVQSAEGWVAKAFIEARGSITPAQVLARIDPAGVGTPDDFREAYADALAPLLVDDWQGFASPRALLPAALLAELIGWEADLGDDYRPVLGLPTSERYPQAFDAVRQRAMGPGALDGSGGLAALIGAFDALYGPPGSGAPLADGFAALAALLAITADEPVDSVMRPSDLERFAARVHHVSGLAALNALEPWERAVLFDMERDFDGDGLPSRDEVLDRAATDELRVPVRRAEATDPLLADTDGDGLIDRLDPCPTDTTDECLIVAAMRRDTDGDGIVDPLDNCLNVANKDQVDANGDGLGDACDGLAHIVEPRYHPVLRTGALLRLRSQPGAAGLAAGQLSYRWSFSGLAPDALVAQPPPLELTRPGTFRIELWVAADAGPFALQDHRELVVIGPAPGLEVTIDVTGELVEGRTVTFTATTSEAADLAWDLGDGTSALGIQVSHVYEQDGQREVTVTATGVSGRIGSATALVAIADTAPVADFVHTASNLTVRVRDASTSWDPIVARQWDFGDGTPPVTGTAVQHTYLAPGTYTVTLQVVDADGSVASTSRAVFASTPPLAVTTVALSSSWQSFALPIPMVDPVLIPGLVGPYEMPDPLRPRRKLVVTPAVGVVRLRNVTGAGFEARFEPFVASATETSPTVTILAVERGHHTFGDGSSWQAESLPVAGANADFTQELYGVASTLVPALNVALQSASDATVVGVRVRTANDKGFEVALMQPHAAGARPHGEEEAGFLAIRSAQGRGQVDILGVTSSWSASRQTLTTRTKTWAGCKIALAVDPAAPGPTQTVSEDAWLLKVGESCFALAVTANDLRAMVVQGR